MESKYVNRTLFKHRQIKKGRELNANEYIMTINSPGYRETGTWLSSSLGGYKGQATRYTQGRGGTAEWSRYAGVDGNYDVYVWYPSEPQNNTALTTYTITSTGGIWVAFVNQKVNAGSWVKLATIKAEAGTVISVSVTGDTNNTRTSAVRFVLSHNEISEMVKSEVDTTTQRIFVNQSGYDTLKAKRATITNVADGTAFTVKDAETNAVVHTGTVVGMVADFTAFQPTGMKSFYIECGALKSYNFYIAKYLMQRVSVMPALRFMDESRSDAFLVGANGVGWRDSHQFSFELESLVLQYQANPSIYERMPWAISNLATCQYTDLRTQNEPDIIWLMKFAVYRYYDLWKNQGKKHHALIKAQLPYFLILYPDIKQYVSEALYTQIRDFAFQVWAEPDSNYHWYETGSFHTLTMNNNLLQLQDRIGGIKGEKPPGYAIRPNLLMYQIAQRDGMPNPEQYFNAAYLNADWLVNQVDLDKPEYTKGQRMSEHVTIQGLAYFQETYPGRTPVGTVTKIDRWIDTMVKRSNNLWDLRKYADKNDGTNHGDQWTGGMIQYNEPGNLAGFMSAAYAAIRVGTNTANKNRLKAIAIAQIDNMFGRNPYGRHYSYDGAREIEGVDVGWFTFYQGGAGQLQNTFGTIDGSPKETAYPFNPNAAYGYTEGWVAFNTAWNLSLAYSAAEDVTLTATKNGSNVTITLGAPLNLNPNAAETGEVNVVTSTGSTSKVTVSVTESSVDDYTFSGTYAIPAGAAYVDISYGYGQFKKTVRITA